MLGSIDCMHWDWKNCPKALHGQFKRSTHKTQLSMLQAGAGSTNSADLQCIFWGLGFLHGLRLSTFVKTFSVARDEKSLKFKRVQEAARKDIERAFGVLQDEGFEVNFKDMFVNPAQNIVRDWVERCDLHVRKTKELRDRKTHTDLRQDLMEHLWNDDDE
ncbi:ALP1-like protein isoform X1 [Tanacetum coccineum]